MQFGRAELENDRGLSRRVCKIGSGRFDSAVGERAQALARARRRRGLDPAFTARNGVVANRDCLRAHGWGDAQSHG